LIALFLALFALGFAVVEVPALLQQRIDRRAKAAEVAAKHERRHSGRYVPLDAMARGEGKSLIGEWQALNSAWQGLPFWHVETSKDLRAKGYIREDLLGLTRLGGSVFAIDPRTQSHDGRGHL
jgi:hypothetical protein